MITWNLHSILSQKIYFYHSPGLEISSLSCTINKHFIAAPSQYTDQAKLEKKVYLKATLLSMRNAFFSPFFICYSIFFIAQFLCERSIKNGYFYCIKLLYTNMKYRNANIWIMSLSFIMSGVFCTANCFESVRQCLNMCLNIMLENETDF